MPELPWPVLGLIIAPQTARVVQKWVGRRDKKVIRTVRVQSTCSWPPPPPPPPCPTNRHWWMVPGTISAMPVTALNDTVDGLDRAGDGRVQFLLPREGINLLLLLRTSLFALRVPWLQVCPTWHRVTRNPLCSAATTAPTILSSNAPLPLVYCYGHPR
ncbi:hypothetical protein BC826DRAFT_530767 [Russula brevipes]|nr:hypothetical protein BC826DRAFT_530767 [Russula brevipes]